MRNLKLSAWVTVSILAAVLAGCQGSKTVSEWSAEPVRTLSGFNVPMAALVDRDGTVYVSNIQSDQENGFWNADAAGFVSRLAPGGQLEDLHWADSNPSLFLNAPKGMCILDGQLYVADINRIVRYPLGDPNQGQDISLEPGRTLVDVTTDGKRIFVSDNSSLRLYRIDPKTLQLSWVTAPAHVAGITYYDGAVYASSIQDHEIYRIDPEGRIPPVPLGLANYFQQPCSIVVLSDGTLVVADYDAGSLMSIAPDRIRVAELGKVDSPGILGLDAKRNLLYVPQIKANQVRIFQLSAHPMSEPQEQPQESAEPAPPHPPRRRQPHSPHRRPLLRRRRRRYLRSRQICDL
jgi:DNA-binding beta-propeller fold protein YncE